MQTKTCPKSVLHQNIVQNNFKVKRQGKDLVTVPITVHSRAVGRCCDGGQLFSKGADGDVPFLGESFSLIFPGTGHQKKAIFLEPVE